MPSLITHSFVAFVSGKIFRKENTFRFWYTSILCATLPDADVIMFYFGIPYNHMFGHRGFSHSILFALIVAVLVVLFAYSDVKRMSKLWWMYLTYFFVLTVSHGVLDAFSNGGFGIGFFVPFDRTRYFFPFRPIQVSPLSAVSFFSSEGREVLFSEFLWVWLPLGVVYWVYKIKRKLLTKKPS
jgi:inner membrane protein